MCTVRTFTFVFVQITLTQCDTNYFELLIATINSLPLSLSPSHFARLLSSPWTQSTVQIDAQGRTDFIERTNDVFLKRLNFTINHMSLMRNDSLESRMFVPSLVFFAPSFTFTNGENYLFQPWSLELSLNNNFHSTYTSLSPLLLNE